VEVVEAETQAILQLQEPQTQVVVAEALEQLLAQAAPAS